MSTVLARSTSELSAVLIKHWCIPAPAVYLTPFQKQNDGMYNFNLLNQPHSHPDIQEISIEEGGGFREVKCRYG